MIGALLVGVVINWLGFGTMGNDALLHKASKSPHHFDSFAKGPVPIHEVDVVMLSERILVVNAAPKNERKLAHPKGKSIFLSSVLITSHGGFRVGRHVPLHV